MNRIPEASRTKAVLRARDCGFSPQQCFARVNLDLQVFSTLWTPQNRRDRPKATDLSTTASNEYAFSLIRHFVVIREKEGYCNALSVWP